MWARYRMEQDLQRVHPQYFGIHSVAFHSVLDNAFLLLRAHLDREPQPDTQR